MCIRDRGRIIASCNTLLYGVMISSSIDYDPFEDITSIFSTKEALDDIDKLIATTRNFKLHLQEKLLVASKEIEKGTDPEHSENTVSTDVIEKVFKDFSETQDISSQTCLLYTSRCV